LFDFSPLLLFFVSKLKKLHIFFANVQKIPYLCTKFSNLCNFRWKLLAVLML
jgi:hypothetical protein